MEKQSIWAKGLYFNKNHPDTPDSVKEWKKGGASVHIDIFSAQLSELKEHANEKGYVNFDLVQNTNKDGETFLSFKLNTWKKEEEVSTPPAQKDIDVSDVEF